MLTAFLVTNRRLQEESDRNEALRRSLGAQLTKNSQTGPRPERAGNDLLGDVDPNYGQTDPRAGEELL